jgi:ABC-type glutathione transport system ATPase component
MEGVSKKKEGRDLLQVKNLVKHFAVENSDDVVRAVDGVTFDILSGETLGLVGESGCGKSTVGRCLLRLHEPTSGEVVFEGKNIVGLRHRDMQELRREMQIIFQDPYASLNPRLTILSIISEPLKIHGIGNRDRTA